MIVHILGVIGDSSYAARIYIKKTQWFRLASLIIVSLYSILWLGWLIWLHIVVFNHVGKVCSGHYLPESDRFVQDNYAIRQGQVLKNIVIGIWCANGGIVLLSVIARIIGARYLNKKRVE